MEIFAVVATIQSFYRDRETKPIGGCRWRRKMGPIWRVEKGQWCGYGMADGEAGKTSEVA
jgi:hypothetical protein